jgi:hypothetical protein
MPRKRLKIKRSLAVLGISVRGSDAAQAPQLAEKNSSLYTWVFPGANSLAPWLSWGGEGAWVGGLS